MATSPEIREGFLCPMCMKDLGTVSQLQSHFEESHSTEDKAVFNQIKGLFDKAKKKFLGESDDDLIAGAAGGSAGTSFVTSQGLGYDPDYWEPQEPGQTRSRTDVFRGVRDARVDRYVVETNKLLIRLDKLVGSDVPTDAGKRKAYEKSIVMWVADSDVKSCPFCGRSFSLTRRRHHCRLCGGIKCDKCSQFLTHSYAKSAHEKLTNPAFQFDTGRESGFLKRSGSSSSLNSMFGSEGDPHIRCCEDCRKLLERRDQQMEQRNTKCTIVLLYERMKTCIQGCEELLQKFLPIVESLSCGESTYSLNEAQVQRSKLVRLYETIDQLSKKIVMLGMNNEELPSTRQVSLQKAIRAYASNYMQENMMGLQNLPSEEQYQNLQHQRTVEMQRRAQVDRQATLAAQEQERRQFEKDSKPSTGSQPVEDRRERSQSSQKSKGWKPAENSVKVSSSDPMLQQIEIIKSYIKQAREAQKWDEVNMLEQNLKDLQRAYSSQQKQTWS